MNRAMVALIVFSLALPAAASEAWVLNIPVRGIANQETGMVRFTLELDSPPAGSQLVVNGTTLNLGDSPSIAGDDVTFRHNVVVGNDSVGIAVLATPFAGLDPRVEPNPDRTRVVDNGLLHNGLHPDPLRAGDRAADIVYDGSGTGNCFAGNVFRTDFPSGIAAQFPCT